jgi:hypothetical protein
MCTTLEEEACASVATGLCISYRSRSDLTWPGRNDTWESPASASNSGRLFCLKRKDDLTKHGTRDVTRYPTRNKGNTVKSPLLKLIAHLLFSLCGVFFEKNELT